MSDEQAAPGLTHAAAERLWGWIDRRYRDLDPRDEAQVRRIVEWIDSKREPKQTGERTEAA